MADALKPGTALIAKVGSILVHLEEARSKDGHHYDWAALDALMVDPEVQEWLDGLRKLTLVPRKRNER